MTCTHVHLHEHLFIFSMSPTRALSPLCGLSLVPPPGPETSGVPGPHLTLTLFSDLRQYEGNCFQLEPNSCSLC